MDSANKITSADDLQGLWDYTYRHPLIRFFHAWGHRQTERFLDKSGLILDLGCGKGEHLKFSSKDNRYVGVDVSFNRIKAAGINSRYSGLICSEAKSLPFRNNSFDAVISIYNLEHIYDVVASLKEICRILKNDGRFIVILPTESLFFRIGRNLTTNRFAKKAYGIDYLELVKKEHINSMRFLVNLLQNHFYIEKKKYHPFPGIFNCFNISLALKMKIRTELR